MEEVKNQLGEQLPGSLEAIRKAVSKFYKKDISTSEMFDLMKNGKLLAKDILPLLGEEFSKMARTGDALRVALASLSTVQQRMNTSFREMINNVYKGGLAEGLGELYRTLDDMFFLMSQGDSNIGKFLKGFIDAAKESIIWTHDMLLDIYYLITEKLGVSGVNAEFLGKVAYWIAIAGALNSVLGIMRMIFGGKMIEMIAIATTRLLGFGAAVATTEAAAAGGAATGAAGGMLGAIKGLGGKVALAAGAYAIYDWFANPHTAEGLQSGVDNLGLNSAFTKPTFQKGFSGGYPNFMQQQPQTGQVVVKLEMNENLRDIVSTHVENNNQKMIQTILPMGWTPTSNQ